MMSLFACGKNTLGFAEYVERCNGSRNKGARVAAARALIAFDHAAVARGNANTAALHSSGLTQQLAVEKSRANAKAWFDVLKPAVDELAAYGEGGIKQETIVSLLQAVGLGAIAKGVN